MIQYKYIHLDNGYKTLLNTSDDNTVFEVSNLIDELRRSIKSKDRQDVYCYIYNEDKSIYYKENNSIVAAFIDCEKELKNRYKDRAKILEYYLFFESLKDKKLGELYNLDIKMKEIECFLSLKK